MVSVSIIHPCTTFNEKSNKSPKCPDLITESNAILGAKFISALSFLFKNMSAIHSADSCTFSESEKVVPAMNWKGATFHPVKESVLNGEPFGRFSFPFPVPS